MSIYVYIWGCEIYGLYPATDVLLEELALNPAGSESSRDTDGEVNTKPQHYKYTLHICFLGHELLQFHLLY